MKKKSLSNLKKHKITFNEAATIFGDSLALTFDDPNHSELEQRFITFGLSRFNRFLVVSHTEREGKTRIIGARIITKNERKIYGQVYILPPIKKRQTEKGEISTNMVNEA